MRVAFAMMGVPPGFLGAGIPLSVKSALTFLLDAGHEVTLISCFHDPDEQPFHPRLRYVHVPWRLRTPVALSLIGDLAQGRAFAAALRSLPPFDVLDVQEANIAPPLFRVADAMGTRKIYTVRQTVLFGPRRFSRIATWLLRHYNLAAARAADRCIAMTEVSRDAHTVYGIDPAKFSVVPDPMEVSEDPVVVRPGAGCKFLWVGRFYPGKAIDVAISAARLVLDELPGARFEIVGTGVLRQLAERLSGSELGKRIVFSGYVGEPEALAEIRSGADVFFFTTQHEAFGRVLVEAMAQGLPCVATDITVLREVMGDAGDYFPMGDAAALAAKLVALARDPARRQRYSVQGRARAERLFSPDAVKQALLACYDGLAEENRRVA